MKHFILDVETKADKNLLPVFMNNVKPPKNYKDEAKIQEWLKNQEKESQAKMAVDPDYAKIICVGIKEVGSEKQPDLFNIYEFATWCLKHDFVREGWRFVTFNGKKFDFPVIIKSGIKENIDLPYDILRNATRRFQTAYHYDLMEIIGEYDFKSLDAYLQIYLGIKKTEIDFDIATDDEIKAHCVEDIINTEQLFNKFRPICN